MVHFYAKLTNEKENVVLYFGGVKYILGPDNEVHVTVRAIFGALGWLLLGLGFGPWGGLPMKCGEPGHDDKDKFKYRFKFKKINLSFLLLPGLGFGPWGGLPMKRGEPGHDDKEEF